MNNALLTNPDSNAVYNIGGQSIPIEYSKDCFEKTADFFYSATYFFLSISPLVLGAFQVVWTSVSIALMGLIYAVKYYVDTNTPEHYH